MGLISRVSSRTYRKLYQKLKMKIKKLLGAKSSKNEKNSILFHKNLGQAGGEIGDQPAPTKFKKCMKLITKSIKSNVSQTDMLPNLKDYLDKGIIDVYFKNETPQGVPIFLRAFPSQAKPEKCDIYAGEMKDDQLCGIGLYCWANGGWYIGQFQDGKKHGQGTLNMKNMMTVSGTFENDKLGMTVIDCAKSKLPTTAHDSNGQLIITDMGFPWFVFDHGEQITEGSIDLREVESLYRVNS